MAYSNFLNRSDRSRIGIRFSSVKKSCTILMVLIALLSCNQQSTTTENKPADFDYQETLMLQLLDATPGTVISVPEGTFSFDRSLSLNIDGVTIKGAGMDKTILSFKNQVAGAEGLLVNASDFTIEDLAIEDSRGDALKINEGNNIIIRRVRTEWTSGPKTKNGAYGLYPVQTSNILIEDSVAIGASDAGIYVGQSDNIIVRGNRAEYNVAGIEIENSTHADVYNNTATNNTGGILVFNMPHLTKWGDSVRVYDNDVFANNTKNFGHKGTPVASVPAGSGIVINSHDRVEIFNNRIRDNKTANIIISSIFTTDYGQGDWQNGFDPYPEEIYIHDNEISGGGNSPDGLDLKALKTAMFGLTGQFPPVLWDGHINSEQNRKPICIKETTISVLNADSPGNFKNPTVETNQHHCEMPGLKPVKLSGL